MTRHTTRTAVSAHTTMTAFFRVGRCVMRDEIRDPTVASVMFCAPSSAPMTTDGVVEFRGDGRVCGSALTRQRNASAKVKARLCAPMMLRNENITQNVVALFFSQNTVAETQKQLSYYWAPTTITSMRCANIQLWVCSSFSYKSLSSGVVKLVSTNVCPLRWLQRFPPDCIRTCVEKRIIRLQKDSAALALLDGNARLCCLQGTLVF